jgi:hypothetical protein
VNARHPLAPEEHSSGASVIVRGRLAGPDDAWLDAGAFWRAVGATVLTTLGRWLP